jgi:hypothetical protein
MYVSRKKNFTSKEVDEKHLYMKKSLTSKVLDVGKVILKMTCENLLTLTMYFITPDIVMTLKKKYLSSFSLMGRGLILQKNKA